MMGVLICEKPGHVTKMFAEPEAWMNAHGYKNREDHCGKLARVDPNESWIRWPEVPAPTLESS
jgi:hypothetical protein